jgi:hypothetical protein
MEFITVKGYDKYKININGDVLSFRKGKHGFPLKKGINHYGYKSVIMLGNDGKSKRIPICEILYITFIGDIPKGMCIYHMNKDRLDDRLENFQLITELEICSFLYDAKFR